MLEEIRDINSVYYLFYRHQLVTLLYIDKNAICVHSEKDKSLSV